MDVVFAHPSYLYNRTITSMVTATNVRVHATGRVEYHTNFTFLVSIFIQSQSQSSIRQEYKVVDKCSYVQIGINRGRYLII